MNRRAFQKLAEARLLDARALLKAKRYDAADYMAGYVIEYALKACIAKRTKRFDFPPRSAADLYTHELERLIKAADLAKVFEQERQKDPQLEAYWSHVKDWKPGRRYELRGVSRASVKAVKDFIKAVEDRQHGVLQCFYKYW